MLKTITDCREITDRMEVLGSPEFIDPLVDLLLKKRRVPDQRKTPAFVLPIICWAFTGHNFKRPLTKKQRANMKPFADRCEGEIDKQLRKDRPLLLALRARAEAMDIERRIRLRGHARFLENWPDWKKRRKN